MVHTHGRQEAQREAFVESLRRAQGLWFTGGRQWRLVDAYRGTLTEHEFHQILARGGVIGGGSAGASIQGSFLVRGDTSGPEVLIGDHQNGFGFIKNSAIDQHLLPRARELDLVEILTDARSEMDHSIDREALLGIGLDEGTAIIVRKNQFEVFGKRGGVVLVYDPRRWTATLNDHQRFQTLHVGDAYDMVRRRILGPTTVNCADTVTQQHEPYFARIRFRRNRLRTPASRVNLQRCLHRLQFGATQTRL